MLTTWRTRTLTRVAIFAGTLSCGGCLPYMTPSNRAYLVIEWRQDFEAARTQAQAAHRPILLCLVAGDLAEPC